MALREINPTEQEVLAKLLSADFPGKEQLAKQLQHARVETIDEEGSIRFVIETSSRADVRQRIPVEAQYLDSDGFHVHLLLHVVDGKIHELEIYKDDGSRILRKADSDNLEILILDC